MLTEEKNTLNHYQHLIFYFFIVFSDLKYLRNLTDFLKIYDIHLSRNTKTSRKTLTRNQTPLANYIRQANYIGMSSKEITEKERNQILAMLLVKNINCIPIIFCQQNKIFRLGFTPRKNNKNHSVLFYSLLND